MTLFLFSLERIWMRTAYDPLKQDLLGSRHGMCEKFVTSLAYTGRSGTVPNCFHISGISERFNRRVYIWADTLASLGALGKGAFVKVDSGNYALQLRVCHMKADS